MRVKLRLAAVSNMRTSPHIGMMTLVDDIECRALVITLATTMSGSNCP